MMITASVSDEVLADIAAADNKSTLATKVDIIFAGHYSTMMVHTGDGAISCVKLQDIRPSGMASPDFHDVEIIDHGQTVRLGKYEAAVDALIDDAFFTENLSHVEGQ